MKIKRPALITTALAITATILVEYELIFIGVLVVALLLYLHKKQILSRFLLLFFILVFILMGGYSFHIKTDKTNLELVQGSKADFIVKVVSYPENAHDTIKIKCRVESVNGVSEPYSSQKVILNIYNFEEDINIRYAQVYKVYANIDIASSEGSFDYSLHHRSSGIDYDLSADASNLTYLYDDPFLIWIGKLFSVRDYSSRVLNENLEKYNASVLSSMFFGTDEVDSDTLNSFRRTGVAHILAVSGLHVGIIYLFISYLLNKLKVKKVLSWIICTIFLIGYAVICSLSVSVIRATFMLTFLGGYGLLNKRSDALNTLALSALALILFNPYVIFSISFQLSYTVVLFIILCHHRIELATKKVQNKYLKSIINTFLMSLLCSIVIAPLIAIHFKTISLLSFLVNAFVFPYISVVMIFGIVSTALSAVPYLSELLFFIMDNLLTILRNFVGFFSDLPFCEVRVLNSNLLHYLPVYFLVLSVCGYFNLKKRKHIYFLAVLLIVALLSSLHIATMNNRSYISYLDVSEGSPVVIHSEEGETIVIDDGRGVGYTTKNNILIDFLEMKNIKKIDCLVLPNLRDVQVLAVKDLMEKYEVEKVLASRQSGSPYEELEYICIENMANLRDFTQKEKFIIGDIHLEPIHLQDINEDSKDNKFNEVVLEVSLRGKRFLFLSGKAEKHLSMLMDRTNTTKYDILSISNISKVNYEFYKFCVVHSVKYVIINTESIDAEKERVELYNGLKSFSINYVDTKKRGHTDIYIDDRLTIDRIIEGTNE